MMISQIKEEIVDKRQWMTDEEMMEIVLIAESTPGPIAINMATYIGYQRGKTLGSFFATLGVVLPSFIIILLISLIFNEYKNNQYVNYAFSGIKCAVSLLILRAGISLFKKSKKAIYFYLVFAFTFILMLFVEFTVLNVSSIILILCFGLTNVVYYVIKNKKEGEK